MDSLFNYLKNNRGIIYEIPLTLAGYGILCALFIPVLQRLIPDRPLIIIIFFMFFGLVVSCFVAKSITIPRVYIFKMSFCFWVFIFLSFVTLPFLSHYNQNVLTIITLLAQVYFAFHVDLWSAKRKEKTLNR